MLLLSTAVDDRSLSRRRNVPASVDDWRVNQPNCKSGCIFHSVRSAVTLVVDPRRHGSPRGGEVCFQETSHALQPWALDPSAPEFATTAHPYSHTDFASSPRGVDQPETVVILELWNQLRRVHSDPFAAKVHSYNNSINNRISIAPLYSLKT